MRGLSTSQLRAAWAPACAGASAVVTLNGGANVTVRAAIIPAVKALSAIFKKHGYEATPPDCGAYNCRPITGGTGYSLHAYKIAIDVNWNDNPYQANDGSMSTNMSEAMIADIEKLYTVNGKPVWRWGGHYTGAHVDPMHFEIVCTPADLATGIKDVTKPVPAPSKAKWVSFKAGDTKDSIVARGGFDTEILEVQLLLTNISKVKNLPALDPKGCDNVYGKGTQDAVKAYKKLVLPDATADAGIGDITIKSLRWVNHNL